MIISRLIFLLSALFIFSVAHAQTSEDSSAIFSAKLSPDVRVIIDISGSMKQNDPQNLRRPALELLVQLFPEGSKAGVWTFGQWVNNLVKSKPVDETWRQLALSQAQKINSVALHTNIPAALEKTVEDIDRLDPNYQVHLILLTDGMVDVSKSPQQNADARQRIIKDILPRIRDAGITIHTVALSMNADQELMERLAVETGGLSAVAETAEDLTSIFLQAFDAAAPAEQVPLEDNSFFVDSSIEEFTALIFRSGESDAASIVSPDDKRSSYEQHSDDIKWFRQQNYDLITVSRPYEGEWKIDADLEPNSRVTIVSNLSLNVNALAKSGFVGDKAEVVAMLSEQGQTITRPEFLDLVDISYQLSRREDGQQWRVSLSEGNRVPADGVFSGSLDMLDQTGVYDVVVRADGKTFQRQQKQTVAIREGFDIRSHSTEENPPNHQFSLFARNPAIDTGKTTVVAQVELPDGSQQQLTAGSTAERRWALDIQGIEQSGFYRVVFEIKGTYKNGTRFNYQSKVTEIEHLVDGSEFFVPEPVAEPEPVAVEPAPEPETAPVPEPKAEPVPEVIPEVADEAMDWGQIGLYIGLGLGNLLVLALGYFAYRTVTGAGSKSDILEADDDEEIDDDDEEDSPVVADPEPESPSEPEAVDLEDSIEDVEDLDAEILDVGEIDVEEVDLELEDEEDDNNKAADLDDLDDILDLPDDAIDIDPASDK